MISFFAPLVLIAEKREARNTGNFYMAPEAKVAFVIRIKGINHIRPQVKKNIATFPFETAKQRSFYKGKQSNDEHVKAH